jgi:fatty acid synthase
VLKLYENETTFLLVGYSFGAILTLKLAKTLESRGITGKVILVDGAPELLQRLITDQLPSTIDYEAALQVLILERSFKLIMPNDSGDRLRQVLTVNGWDAKMKRIEELYEDLSPYSKEFGIKSFTALLNRITMLVKLDLKAIERLNTPLTLIKPSEATIQGIGADYGLKAYAVGGIDIQTMQGNHMSILENPNLPILINDAF